MTFFETYQHDFEFLGLFLLNFVMAFVLIRLFYYPASKNREYFFSFLIFNVVVFFIIGLFRNVEMSVGFGFGIFALFSLLRYRTDMIPVREMSYLFIMIGLAFIHSLSGDISMNWAELFITDALLLLTILFLEKGLKLNFERSKVIVYENVENIKQGKQSLMLEELRKRTGIYITRYRIDQIDYLRDVARITVYFSETSLKPPDVNQG
jgi:hypothetical protein